MEKMNNNKIQRMIARAEREKGNIEFYQMNLPISIELLEKRHLKRKDKLTYLAEKKKLRYHIQLGQLSGYPEALKTELTLDINNTFNLKKRALNQKLKRHLAKKGLASAFDQKFSQLDKDHQKAIETLEMRFSVPSHVALNKQHIHQKIDQINQKLAAKLAHMSKKEVTLKTLWTEQQKKRLKLSTEKFNQYMNFINDFHKTSQTLDQLSDDAILKLENISMQFGGLKAVNNLSFEVKKGEIFGLIGPNGAGKTTIFNCITRFYLATEGNIYYRNHYDAVINLNDFVVHNVIKQGIVRTFQNVELIWELNVIDNLLVGAHTTYQTGFFSHMLNTKRLRQEEQVQKAKAYHILETLELTPYAYMYPLGLPYGILKKVELARTLMTNPKLIILDEPAAGLNDQETESLAKTIKKIRDAYQATIFLVEHDMGLVMDICDTVCAISFGKKLAIGTPKEIQANKLVREAYLGGE